MDADGDAEPGSLVLAAAGPAITSRTARDVIGEAAWSGARLGIESIDREAFVNYRLRLVIVGEVPAREANRGDQAWFVASLDDVEVRRAARRVTDD